MHRVLKLKESEVKEYRYITTHGIGPGTLPNGTYVRSEELEGGKTAVYTNRPLSAEELKKYDIKDEWIQEDEVKLPSEENSEETKKFIQSQLDKSYKERKDLQEDGEELPLPIDNPDEIKPEEDLEDKIADEIPDEEYMVDPILNELRDVLVDLDWNLFMLGNDEVGPVYIIGRLNDNGIEEMLVEDGETFRFIELPNTIEEILNYNTVYGNKNDIDDEAGEDVEIAPEENLAKGVPHEEIMEYLMNKLVEINPEAAKEIKKEEPVEELPLPEPEEGNDEEGVEDNG